ncbi:DUF2812 domain-containing protein [Bacillus lacus]|uniref:DUF2812 domain-containing protein n=1 Tax=Metabacillus lacus TaxID=1983721 RepID=A0A7X2J099_9BACI|nr:DUF2812 domain-containing protein [Metabacillus lacus]MRX72373.1 DUF2812 domain-containing protein [Metabacillus lacus]
MRNSKYVMSNGLAFSEEKDMDKLRKFSLQGWHVRDFSFLGYTLEKGVNSEYIYNVDYRSLKENESEEYLDLLSSSGWNHVTSQGNIHLFRASPGTAPIYSDRETVVEKHADLGSSMKVFSISLVAITALVWLGTFISKGFLNNLLALTAVILTIIAVPAIWTVLTVYNNKWKAQGNKNVSTLIKIFPFIAAVPIFLLFVDDFSKPFLILVSMIIGAVTLPAVIWIIMSLYHRLFGKNHHLKKH